MSRQQDGGADGDKKYIVRIASISLGFDLQQVLALGLMSLLIAL